MDKDSLIGEFTVVLNTTISENVKLECLKVLAGFTGPDCYDTIRKNQDLIGKLIILLNGKNINIAQQACINLINLSSEVNCARAILYKECSACNRSGEYCTLCKDRDRAKNIIPVVIKSIIQKDCAVADGCCQLLCNLSRNSEHANFIMDSEFYEDVSVIDRLVDAFCDLNYNTADQNLNYLGLFFSNLTQSVSGLQILCDHAKRLLPFTGYEDSVIRRQGIAGMLRNISFRTEKHEWLLNEEGLNILPALLLPLAGPEEFPDDEMDKLPIELQYLPETKQREADPEVRQMLLETLLMLCNGKEGRVFIREKNTYIILRELHKVETNLKVKLACENVVDILIRTEDEIGLDKLKDVPDVPDDLKKKFEAMDKDFVEDK